MTSRFQAANAQGNPYLFSQDQVESRLAIFDILAAGIPLIQTQFPDYLRRPRLVNPNGDSTRSTI